MKIPLTSAELIAELDRLFPEVTYDPDEKHDEFLLRSGERRLVLCLKRALSSESDDAEGEG